LGPYVADRDSRDGIEVVTVLSLFAGGFVRIPREAWKLDKGGEASHGYGTSVNVLVRAKSSARLPWIGK
jgi:hypothetical protein